MIALQHDPSAMPKEKDGTDIADLKLFSEVLHWPLSPLELAVSVLCLCESCYSPISFFPSLLLPAEVKMSH